MKRLREKRELYIGSSDWPLSDLTQQARMLERALIGAAIITLLIIPFSFNIFRQYPIRFYLTGWTLLINLVGLRLLRAKRIRLTGILTAYGYWLSLTILVATSGGLFSPWVLGQLALVVVSGILFGGRAAVTLAVLSVVVDTSFYYLQGAGFPIYTETVPVFTDAFAAVFASFILVALTMFLARNMVQRGLRRAQQNESRYLSLFERTNDALFLVNPEEVLISVNQRAADMLGYEVDELIGVPYSRLVTPEEKESSDTNFVELHQKGLLPLFERTLVRKDGSRCTVEFSASVVKDSQGEMLYFQGVARNVNERKLLEQQLKDSLVEMEHVAMHDPLTGLLNRRAITEKAEMEWHRANRENRPLSMMLLDIDTFKQINDEYGHMVGDQVLKSVATALRGAIRDNIRRGNDWAGRWGGDEFLVVLPGANLPASEDVGERLRSLVIDNPVALENGRQITLQVSVGVACYSGRPGEEIPLERLLIQADQALYAAKESGRNKVSVFRDKVG